MNAAATPAATALRADAVSLAFRRRGQPAVQALDRVSLEVRPGELTALIGPDGGGKTTLIRLAAGLLRPDSGAMTVLGIDAAREPQRIQDRVSYMPQRFGLYEDLTVAENLRLYADLHGVSEEERAGRLPRLMEMTALGPFQTRPVGKLSGGMKQKLGLACALVRSPELLLLDEPTVGVDPLSRRELWEIVRQLVADEGLTVLLSTAYLDEAERCSRVVLLRGGAVLSADVPAALTGHAAGLSHLVAPKALGGGRALQAHLLDQPDIIDAVPQGAHVRFVRDRTGPASAATDALLAGLAVQPVAACFEDGVMVLLRGGGWQESVKAIDIGRRNSTEAPTRMIEVRGLQKRFGTFMAVDQVSFDVGRGEIFGLLGANGAGKTTTFRMLCGLLRPDGGELQVAGQDVRHAPAAARARLGYVAQKFSLYDPLTVTENLEFFASAYGLRGQHRRDRIAWVIEQFELALHADVPSGQLPGGFKQRLAMAAALMHEPDILFLDEPTSGADPRARRVFWRRITALAEQGVTVIVTTHFMPEAEYCDRVAIMDGGKVLAQGSPADICRRAGTSPDAATGLEDAFIAIVERGRVAESTSAAPKALAG